MNHLTHLFAKLRLGLRAFAQDTSGGLSVEYAMWVPFMASGMVLTTDITILMREQSHLFVIARDTSRMVAVGLYDTNGASTEMERRLGDDKAYTVTAVADGAFVTAEVSVPFTDVLVFGGLFTGENTLNGHATMLIEGASTVDADAAPEAQGTFSQRDTFSQDDTFGVNDGTFAVGDGTSR